MKSFAGAATKIINCEIGDNLQGQLGERLCEQIRDNLEANFFYIANENEKMLLVSLDVCAISSTFAKEVCQCIERTTKIPADHIIIACTHTHTGPSTQLSFPEETLNEKYLERLTQWIIEGATDALTNAVPAKLGYGAGQSQIGFNRRACWRDGSHSMFEKKIPNEKVGEFTGLEGPDDPTHSVLTAVDSNNELIAILHNNTCHATCMEMAKFVSADYPGEARKQIRDILNKDIPVLYFCGAAGDIMPWDMEEGRYDGEIRSREMGALLAGETMKISRLISFQKEPIIKVQTCDMSLGVRLPSETQLTTAKATASERRGTSHILALAQIAMFEQYKNNPVDTVSLKVARIGDLAIATNPCELFCQFGLDIKRRSPADITMISSLTNGLNGYCPTMYGLLGGGYSCAPGLHSRLEPFAGYKIVDTTAKLLREIWNEKE